MEGRGAGTAGAERAARHIAGVFREAGLVPAGDAGGYLQSFSVPTGVRLGAANSLVGVTSWNAALTPALPPERERADALAVGRDFTPLAVSSDGDESAEIAFAGYGITALDLHHDDYAGVDARGRIVAVLTGEPRASDPQSPFRRPTAYHYTERRHKITNAREHGARAVLLIPHPADREALPRLSGVSQPAGIAAVALTRGAADALLAPSGRTVAELAAAVDRGAAPATFPLANARARVRVSLVRDRGPAWNVVGVLPGTDPRLAREAVIVGAHYDHLGRGGEGSLAPDEVGAVHPGADDNASGTAAVLALARAFAAAGGAARTLVFAAFSGEELGLLGSSHFVRALPAGGASPVLMVNLDMVGRLRAGKVYVAGVDSGDSLRALAADSARGLPLSPELRGDPYSPSDHTVFYTAGVPVLFLFTGAHADYHRPSDTWDKLDPDGLLAVTRYAERIVAGAAAAPAPPAYVKIAAAPVRATGGGYGPYFGIVPDFGEAERPGTLVGGVRPGSPAEKAGVRAGDVIVEFGGVTVLSLEDLTFALRSHRPGDRVAVGVVRDGQPQRFEATLEERR